MTPKFLPRLPSGIVSQDTRTSYIKRLRRLAILVGGRNLKESATPHARMQLRGAVTKRRPVHELNEHKAKLLKLIQEISNSTVKSSSEWADEVISDAEWLSSAAGDSTRTTQPGVAADSGYLATSYSDASTASADAGSCVTLDVLGESAEVALQSYNTIQNSACFTRLSDATELSRINKTSLHTALQTNFGCYAFKLAMSSVDGFYYYSASNMDTEQQLAEETADFIEDGDDSVTVDEFIKVYGVQPIKLAQRTFLAVRFTPGYKRFFNRLREDFMKSHYKSFTYQHRLTSYITRYTGFSNAAILAAVSFNLARLLVLSYMSPTHQHACSTILSGAVFVNGVSCKRVTMQLQPNDVVQLRANYGAYVSCCRAFDIRLQNIQWALNLFKTLEWRLSDKIELFAHRSDFSGGLAFSKIKVYRLVSIYLLLRDVPDYLELDFLSLSYAVIATPSRADDHDLISIRQAALSYVKMLNWKYIS